MVHLTRSGGLHPVRERQKYCPSIARKRFPGMGFVLSVLTRTTLVAEETTHRSASQARRKGWTHYMNRYHAFLSANNDNRAPQETQRGTLSQTVVTLALPSTSSSIIDLEFFKFSLYSLRTSGLSELKNTCLC